MRFHVMPEVMIEEPGMSSWTATSTGTRILDADILSSLFFVFPMVAVRAFRSDGSSDLKL